MKKLLLAATILLSTSMYFSCGTKEKDPEPGYYFKFKADGVQYDYKYEHTYGFTGGRSNMGSFQSTTTAWGGTFQIYAYSNDNPSARGEVRFFLDREDFDNLDTIVLDGSRNDVSLLHPNFAT